MAQLNFKWLDGNEYPFVSHYFKVNGHQLHYIDEGVGATILFVHGTPSWSFDYRNLIKPLRNDFRCIAFDHIGFGLSDKPEDYDYSTLNHSLTLEKFVLEKDLKDITLVVHDFGGPIGLQFAIKHPERVKRLVILNSWLWSSEGDPDYIKLRRILKSPFLPFLYKLFNFSPRFILPRSFGDKKLPKHLLKQYTKPFKNSSERNGALAFAKSLLHDQAWFEKLWEQKNHINNMPTLFIWGMKDPVIKPKYLDKFVLGFPNFKIIKLETCGHFPQEEEPEKVVEAIRRFLGDKKDA
jgi:pimeloyl-ACP methyl ester carboxylesterase